MTLDFEQGPIRPPSEARSLLVRVTRNCPWNRCDFCPVYKGKKFSMRTVEEIKRDIDTVREMVKHLHGMSWRAGLGGRVDRRLVEAILQESGHSESFRSVALWLYYGGESAFPDYAAQVKALARHPNIRFAGPLDYRQVGAALRQMDCLVVPSVWYENSPLVIQEAYAVGLPVVASRLGALVEKVQDHRTGYLFAPGDSADLARVLREIVERPERLGALRGNVCPGPDIQQHVQQIVGLYRGIGRARPEIAR